MPERDACNHGPEQGSDRIVVAAAAAPRLRLRDKILVRQVLENQYQALRFQHVIGFPGKRMWIVLGHIEIPSCGLICGLVLS